MKVFVFSARAAQGKEICGKIMEYIMGQEGVLSWDRVFYDHHRQLFATERIDDVCLVFNFDHALYRVKLSTAHFP